MDWRKDVIVPLIAAVVGAAATLSMAWFGFLNKDRELDIKMLEIALGILREDPEESKIAAARGWAIDVINASAPVQITGAARDELIKQRIDLQYERNLKNAFQEQRELGQRE